ncbi:type II toxin-antitoxin system RelE/ParE family toxin [bacterium]|nr:type II toxin-antitoxin system RelE/ParE family toxin [bacterium]
MKVQYRKSFLRDLKKLKGRPIYDKIFELAFTILPEVDRLSNLTGVKAMKGYPNRYRIRIGNYRIGIEVYGESVEVMRVLHRREFYRYFP